MTQTPIIKCDCMDANSKFIIQQCLDAAIRDIQYKMDMTRDMMSPREMRERPDVLQSHRAAIEEHKQIMRALDSIRPCPE